MAIIARTMAGEMVRGESATIPQERRGFIEDRYTRAAEEEDAYGPRLPQESERVEVLDLTLIAGVPVEEVMASIARGWAPDHAVAEACRAYQARLHAPWLMESEPLPVE